ncbi:MAG: MarR family transcriptional regulator [Acidobacteriota bacterium]|nr:MarR family transcriptional regulator [Acidobacteriota bacterium]
MSTRTSLTSQSIADELHSAAVQLLRGLRKVDAGAGLNAPRLSALSVVVFGGPVSLGDLAAAEQVRPPTMTRIVNALEKQGLVTKVRDQHDRRNIAISATMKGKMGMIQGRNRRIQSLADRIERLDAPERNTLHCAAAAIRKMMQHN